MKLKIVILSVAKNLVRCTKKDSYSRLALFSDKEQMTTSRFTTLGMQ